MGVLQYDIIVEIDVETRSSWLSRRGRLCLADERLHEPPFLTKNYLSMSARTNQTPKQRLLGRIRGDAIFCPGFRLPMQQARRT